MLKSNQSGCWIIEEFLRISLRQKAFGWKLAVKTYLASQHVTSTWLNFLQSQGFQGQRKGSGLGCWRVCSSESTGNKFKDKSTKVTSPFDTEYNWEGFLSKKFLFSHQNNRYAIFVFGLSVNERDKDWGKHKGPGRGGEIWVVVLASVSWPGACCWAFRALVNLY